MDVGRLLLLLRIVVPILLFVATVLILQAFTNLHWIACAVLGVIAALLDVFVIMPFTERSAQNSIE